jgi:hypothetical protein
MNPVTPTRRVVRTVVQVLLAVAAAIPAAVGVLGLPASTAAAAVSIAGAFAVIVSAAHNGWDQTVGNS